MKKQGMVATMVAIVVVFLILVVTIVTKTASRNDSIEPSNELSLSELAESVNATQAELTKGQVSLEDNNLYDELPEITKYPLAVEGSAEVNVEIFTSGEKAGQDTDSFLIEAAKNFNNAGVVIDNGRTVNISVRSMQSGLGADYIASGKYVPDLYTPSNLLFGEYCKANGGDISVGAERLVGNTAGILVKKDSGYKDISSVIADVQAGKLNLGYTNPQTSATGLNLLLEILKTADSSNLVSDKAVESFSKFNDNIPYVAYTTQQMRDSASNGSLDAIVSEYQAYVNDSNLKSMYDFIPFGVRHDNPLYICNASVNNSDKIEAVDKVIEYLTSAEVQKIATADGFNANDDYKSDYETNSSEVVNALKAYKKNKDSGKEILAVFVADCSGSMDGEPMQQLKESLSNGAKYIGDDCYIGLVSYSNDVSIDLPINKFDFNQRSYLQGAVDNLVANGGTATYNALAVAGKMIEDAKTDHPDAKCMIILLSDGQANGGYSLSEVSYGIKQSGIPIYTISYGESADTDQLSQLSSINEAASINADSDDIIYKIKSLFNSQL